MKKILLSGFIFLSFHIVSAQELKCDVIVLTDQIQSSDKKIYTTLQTSIYEFMNNTRWTNDQFTNQERIECSIQISISERVSTDEFRAQIQVQSRRPVYKTSYYSPLLNINDEFFQFRYVEYQTLEYNESGTNQNLPAVLAFYANLILGVDYDSFSLKGGSKYLQQAQTIVANQQNSPEKGWRAFESDRNRYWLAENFNNPIFEPIRNLIYNYHRKGMDIMSEKKEESLTTITKSIEGLRPLYNDKPGNFLMQMMLFAKVDEIINIFSGAYPEVKTKIVNTLNEIDPSNSNRYQAILSKN